MTLPPSSEDTELERLFAAERSYEELLADEVHARVRDALRIRLGTPSNGGTSSGGGSGGGSPGASPVGGATVRLSHAVLGMIGTLVVGAVGGAIAMRSAAPMASGVVTVSAPQPASSPPRIDHAASPVVEPPPLAPPTASQARSQRAPAASTSTNAEAVVAERALLDAARTALANGEPAEALAFGERHETEFSRGRLVEEREALIIRALVKLGRGPEARERGARFAATWPRSLALPAVTAALESLP
jgi:hypothetical protein